MEWGGNSSGKAPQGNGLSQRDAAQKAQLDFAPASDTNFVIPRFVSVPENASPLETALANLARVPPKAYDRPGMAESFLLAAGSALERFANGPLTFLAVSLIKNRRDEFVAALKGKGELNVEQFNVRANTGCLTIEDRKQGVRIFVKTPFAPSEQC
jgi:hypothetical protein